MRGLCKWKRANGYFCKAMKLGFLSILSDSDASMIMIRFSVIFMFSSWVSGNMQIHVRTWETFLATGQKHKSVKHSTISGFPRSVAATCQHADAVILSLCLYLFVCLLVWINLLSVCICISIAAIRWCSVAETGKSSCCRCSQLCNFVNLYFGFVICNLYFYFIFCVFVYISITAMIANSHAQQLANHVADAVILCLYLCL